MGDAAARRVLGSLRGAAAVAAAAALLGLAAVSAPFFSSAAGTALLERELSAGGAPAVPVPDGDARTLERACSPPWRTAATAAACERSSRASTPHPPPVSVEAIWELAPAARVDAFPGAGSQRLVVVIAAGVLELACTVLAALLVGTAAGTFSALAVLGKYDPLPEVPLRPPRCRYGP